MKPGASLPYSQEPVIGGLCPESDEYSPQLQASLFQILFNITLLSMTKRPRWTLLLRLSGYLVCIF
jgi:hypothetical protein